MTRLEAGARELAPARQRRCGRRVLRIRETRGAPGAAAPAVDDEVPGVP